MTISKRVKNMTWGQLAELLSYYSLYDTARRSGEDTRPSGPALQAYLQQRFRELDKTIPKPVKESGQFVVVDLWLLHEDDRENNLLLNLEKNLNPYFHAGNKALKRKPKEIAREVLLALFENNLYNGKRMSVRLFLMCHETPFKPAEGQLVQVRGLDWVIYAQLTHADEQQE